MKDYDMSLHAMREEDIKKAAKEFSITNGDMQYGFIKGAEWAESQHDWIPVSERMPDESGFVQVLSNIGTYGFGFYDKDKNELLILALIAGNNSTIAEYWMPMPPAPSK